MQFLHFYCGEFGIGSTYNPPINILSFSFMGVKGLRRKSNL